MLGKREPECPGRVMAAAASLNAGGASEANARRRWVRRLSGRHRGQLSGRAGQTGYIGVEAIQRDLERSHQGYRLKGRTPVQALMEALGGDEIPESSPPRKSSSRCQRLPERHPGEPGVGQIRGLYIRGQFGLHALARHTDSCGSSYASHTKVLTGP
jgi:hypothetical protein